MFSRGVAAITPCSVGCMGICRRASVFCDAGEILVRGLLSLLMGEL